MVTAVLLKYKRLDELEQVIRNLRSYYFITEILIHDNTNEKTNVINYGRYVEAHKASNSIIYTQDDDCIVNDVGTMFNIYNNHKGEVLVNGLKPSHMDKYQGITSMCGWGAFFNKEWIKVLSRYTRKYGADYTFYRETDRIFTGLLDVPRKTVEVDVVDFPSATDEFALYKQPEHKKYANLAKERVDEIIASTA